MVIRINSLDGLHAVVDALLNLIAKGYRIITLFGDLGAGKTALVNAFCQKTGVMEPVTSPTFSLVQEYLSPGQGIIYHMDLYRLDKPQDLEQIGFEEYLDSGKLCFIEWPELANDYFTMPHLRIEITLESDNIRNFKITTHDAVDA